jgi:carboxypeptidase T
MPHRPLSKLPTTAIALAAALLTASTLPAVAGPQHDHSAMRAAEKARTQIYRAWFPSPALARRAAVSLHHALLESDYAAGFQVYELEPAEVSLLTRFGFRVELAPDVVSRRDELLDQIEANNAARRAADPKAPEVGIQSIPGYACYETVEETFAAAQGFASSKPQLASWLDAGDSWQKTTGSGGYDIGVLVLTNSAVPGPKPKLLINSAIHAREYTTAPLVLEFARWLVNGHGVQRRRHLDPGPPRSAPDAAQPTPTAARSAEAGPVVAQERQQQPLCQQQQPRRRPEPQLQLHLEQHRRRGLQRLGLQPDLPRPLGRQRTRNAGGGSLHPQPVARPPRPAANDAAPADTSGIHLDIHSYSQLVLWPWGEHQRPRRPTAAALQTLGRRLAWFNGYTPSSPSACMPPTAPATPQLRRARRGGFTIELGTSFFQSCTTTTTAPSPPTCRR